jgi:uncharacterized protein with HEPN domain
MKNEIGDKIRLYHIRDAIFEIESYVEGVTFEKFIESSLHKATVIKQLEIIGEAANKISNNLQLQNEFIKWEKIISLRNILVHEYFGVDYVVIWNIIKIQLPELKNNIETILKKL